jgi:transposase-like protein
MYIGKDIKDKQVVQCKNCDKGFEKKSCEIKKTKNHFCCQSCAATYTNTHKTKGTRRSKLELWLEEQLTAIYPTLPIMYSDKTTINSELDIYIPSLSLAFELNGLFHYEPIFGEDKLNQIQNNDGRKFQACLEHNIELCIIDTSQHKYVKPSTSQKYLDVITKLVNYKLSKTDRVEVL